MKKLISLLLALILLAAAPLASLAIDDKLDSVALVLYLSDENLVIGTAVLVETGEGSVWITPSAWLREGGQYALMMENGGYAMVASAEPLGETGLAALNLDRPLDATPVPLSEAALDPAGEALVGYLSSAALVSGGAEHLSACTLADGSEGVTCLAMPGMLPGAGIYDNDGALSGIFLYAFGEGEGRYMGITANGIRAALSAPAAPAPAAEAPEGSVSGQGVVCTIDGGYLIITPDPSVIPAGTQVAVYMMYGGNEYFSWLEGTMNSQLAFVSAAIPGRTVALWVGTGSDVHGAAEFNSLIMSRDPVVVNVPPATPMDRYDYQQECYLSLVPAGTEVAETERLAPAEAITRQILTSGKFDLYFQINSSYTVTEDLQESLLFCLDTPDGTVMFSIASFLYGVDFMAQDDWHHNVTEMFSDYMTYVSGELPGGEYTLSYYIGSSLAGSCSFTLPDIMLEDGGESV